MRGANKAVGENRVSSRLFRRNPNAGWGGRIGLMVVVLFLIGAPNALAEGYEQDPGESDTPELALSDKVLHVEFLNGDQLFSRKYVVGGDSLVLDAWSTSPTGPWQKTRLVFPLARVQNIGYNSHDMGRSHSGYLHAADHSAMHSSWMWGGVMVTLMAVAMLLGGHD